MYNDDTEVTVDGRTYRLAQLSEEARAQVLSLQFVQAEIERLNAKLAVYATARIAYQNALMNLVPRTAQ
jgi:hypothetical protein